MTVFDFRVWCGTATSPAHLVVVACTSALARAPDQPLEPSPATPPLLGLRLRCFAGNSAHLGACRTWRAAPSALTAGRPIERPDIQSEGANRKNRRCSLPLSTPQKKGTFGHSSFLAGGAVGAAGQIAVDHGRIVKLAPLSGETL